MKTQLQCLAIVAALFLSSCASTTLVRQPTTGLDPVVSIRYPLYFFGWFDFNSPVSLDQACQPKTWVQVQTRVTPLDLVLGTLTLGIYTPRTVTVTCQGATAGLR